MPSAVSLSPTTPGTFQAGTWMGYEQARHNQPSASSSSSSLASRSYPHAAAGAWICLSLADGCWAEGGTQTFACEGKTGAVSLSALVPLCCPSDSWRSRVPPRPPFSYSPCSAGNGGVGCACSSALCTLITGWLFNDGSVSSPPPACGWVLTWAFGVGTVLGGLTSFTPSTFSQCPSDMSGRSPGMCCWQMW